MLSTSRRRRAPASTTRRSHPSGYGYLTTRDGTQLAINVHPPQDVADALPLPDGIELPKLGDGPYPTLIEYSGYGYADPAGPQSGIAVLANLMGFTVVDVNMRGTGCSGGAFDFFEPLQSLDGYDVMETIARQPWVLHGKVGMMGISYGGISQLFTGQMNPPSLAAISPLSVIDSTQTTLYPGGILNTGFAVAWAQERIHDAQAGVAHRRAALGLQADPGGRPDLQGQPGPPPRGRGPHGEDPRERSLRARRRRPAVAGDVREQDQRPGVHGVPVDGRADRRPLPDPGEALHRDGPQVVHVHERHPRRLARARDFQPLVRLPPALRGEAGADRELGAAPGRRAGRLPGGDGDNGRDAAARSDPAAAHLRDRAGGLRETAVDPRPLRQRRRRPAAGPPGPRLRALVVELPDPGHHRAILVHGPGRRARRRAPAQSGADTFTWNAKARPPTNFTGNTAAGEGGLWTATPPYQWTQNPPGSAASFVTTPLSANTTVVGAGAVKVWVRSSAPNVDLQATISEVRPDGKETFVQGGWVRGNMRKLDAAKSTPLEPVLSLRAADVAPMPSNRFVEVTIPLYYQGHVYRAGSRIRVTVSAPNGDQPIWAFGEADPRGTATVAIARSRRCRPGSCCRSSPA